MKSKHRRNLFGSFPVWLRNRFNSFRRRFFSWFNTRDKLIALALLLLWLGIILSNFILKGSYIFEGNLVVRQMSFIYNGEIPRSFISDIGPIKSLYIEGFQKENLTLVGTFSTDDSQLNSQLKQLKQIEIGFNNSQSRLWLESEKFNLSLSELRINPQTRVNRLEYDFKGNQLSFCLAEVSDSCLDPTSLQPKSLQEIADLTLILPAASLTLTLADVSIPKLQINSNTNSQEVTLNFIPDKARQEKKLILSSLAQFRLKTKTLTKDSANNWFWEDIEVKNVNFSEFARTGKVTDEVQKCTILKGEVRLEGNKLELQEQQFLIVESPNPGIRKLRSLEINLESPAGLRTFFTGQSRGISVGLYPDFPVQSLKPSWLAKHLSQEAVNGILALLGAFTGIFLPRLFPEKSQNP